MIHTLSIEFQGICAHFRGVVPGVPHRVVIPDASALRVGFVEIDGQPIPYALMPHIAGIVVKKAGDACGFLKEQSALNIPDVMVFGAIVDGVRLQVANATQNKLSYQKGYDRVPAIRDFVPHRNFNEGVVLGGQAAAYVDFFVGEVRSEQVGDANSPGMRTIVTVETDGPPVLLATPFFPSEEPGESAWGETHPVEAYYFELKTDNLIVGNFDLAGSIAPGFDYLWHFTTVQGGIPRKLAATPPGFTPRNLDAAHLARVSAQHAAAQARIRQAEDWSPIVAMYLTEPSCSDSRFP